MNPAEPSVRVVAATLAAAVVASKGKPVTTSLAVSTFREVLAELARSETQIQ